MTTTTYFVPSIHCMHCTHTIKSELSELAGVKSVDADEQSKKVTITFEAPATPELIENLLVEISYPPEK